MRRFPETQTVQYYPVAPVAGLGESAYFFGATTNILSVAVAGALFWQVGRAMQPRGSQYWGPMAAVAGVISPAVGLGALALLSMSKR
jgi:ApbE superfamily uncharacterized protein (UPF0280 family)